MVGIKTLLLSTAALLSNTASATTQDDLIGTWTSKSARVLTGPDFYNPINDSFSEPYTTGISYSFTKTHYESALYRSIANATDPKCPGAVLQWQHGTYTIAPNNSLILNPFGVDGRQMLSMPCDLDYSRYERFAQQEVMKTWEVSEDRYKRVKRLDLGLWDGKMLQPMYLAYRPPMMLPTSTMNPTGVSAKPLATYVPPVEKNDDTESMGKRSNNGDGGVEVASQDSREPLNKHANLYKRSGKISDSTPLDYAKVFLWASIGMILFGGLTLLMGRKTKAPKRKRAPVPGVELQ